ncbi:hypothetical protein DDE83_004382 [Stemphylium lycopersici]|uniref:Uncharacterized protein n=1 Tax=Stemphylium lycopersici TaxID=183478 RepID=A0A364N4N7_STELY|nr:hypothetical protein DDE83_004382 [Stemphylium lycopersici]
MRYSTITTAFLALAPVALSQSSSTPITSMVPMMAPSAPPVTMAWNDAPSATDSVALTSEASSLNSAMQSAVASVSMEMESGMGMMTMSDGSVMATGSAMAEMIHCRQPERLIHSDNNHCIQMSRAPLPTQAPTNLNNSPLPTMVKQAHMGRSKETPSHSLYERTTAAEQQPNSSTNRDTPNQSNTVTPSTTTSSLQDEPTAPEQRLSASTIPVMTPHTQRLIPPSHPQAQVQIMPRAVSDYVDILHAMATGDFRVPVFGAAGWEYTSALLDLGNAWGARGARGAGSQREIGVGAETAGTPTSTLVPRGRKRSGDDGVDGDGDGRRRGKKGKEMKWSR